MNQKIIAVAPTIVTPEDSLIEYVKEGDNFHVECKVDGSPPPEISWTKVGYLKGKRSL